MSGQTPAPNDWCVTTTAELAELQRLRRDNAELLEALKDAVSALNADVSKSPLGERNAKLAQGWFEAKYGDKARAAISKAEGWS